MLFRSGNLPEVVKYLPHLLNWGFDMSRYGKFRHRILLRLWLVTRLTSFGILGDENLDVRKGRIAVVHQRLIRGAREDICNGVGSVEVHDKRH